MCIWLGFLNCYGEGREGGYELGYRRSGGSFWGVMGGIWDSDSGIRRIGVGRFGLGG